MHCQPSSYHTPSRINEMALMVSSHYNMAIDAPSPPSQVWHHHFQKSNQYCHRWYRRNGILYSWCPDPNYPMVFLQPLRRIRFPLGRLDPIQRSHEYTQSSEIWRYSCHYCCRSICGPTTSDFIALVWQPFGLLWPHRIPWWQLSGIISLCWPLEWPSRHWQRLIIHVIHPLWISHDLHLNACDLCRCDNLRGILCVLY